MCLIPFDFHRTKARTRLLRGMDFSLWPRRWGRQQCSRGLTAASLVRFYLGKLLCTHTRLLSSRLPSAPWAGCSLPTPQRLLQPHCFTLLASAGATLHFNEWWQHQGFIYWGDRRSMLNHQLSRHKGLRELTLCLSGQSPTSESSSIKGTCVSLISLPNSDWNTPVIPQPCYLHSLVQHLIIQLQLPPSYSFLSFPKWQLCASSITRF